MRSLRIIVPLVAIGLGLAVSMGFAADPEYVGESRCKMCHRAEHQAWTDGPHAGAFELLEAKDRENPECLACHQTGYGAKAAEGAELAGVQCEACHGPGSLYKSPKIMSKSKYRDGPEVAHAQSIAAGMVVPDAKTCEGCHNDRSPTFAGFEAETAMTKIRHGE